MISPADLSASAAASSAPPAIPALTAASPNCSPAVPIPAMPVPAISRVGVKPIDFHRASISARRMFPNVPRAIMVNTLLT